MSDPAPRFFLECDLDESEVVPVQGGVVAVYSHRAPGSTGVNEDAAVVLDLVGRAVILAVADGMGGGATGQKASALALQELVGTVVRDVGEGADVRHAVLDGFEAANRAVAGLQTGAATTLAVVAVSDHQFRSLHAGDTAVLQVGGRGRLKLATVPHSPTGYAVEAGLLREKEALVHSERHVVSNMVGDHTMTIEMTAARSLAARDTLLIGSDGLFDNLTTEEVAAAVRKGPLGPTATRLAQRCRARMEAEQGGRPGKLDDLTVLLYRRAAPVRPPRTALSP